MEQEHEENNLETKEEQVDDPLTTMVCYWRGIADEEKKKKPGVLTLQDCNSHFKTILYTYVSRDIVWRGRSDGGKSVYVPPQLYNIPEYQSSVTAILNDATEVVPASKWKGLWALATYATIQLPRCDARLRNMLIKLLDAVREGVYERRAFPTTDADLLPVLDLLDGKNNTIYRPKMPTVKKVVTRKRAAPRPTSSQAIKPKRARTMNVSRPSQVKSEYAILDLQPVEDDFTDFHGYSSDPPDFSVEQ